MCKDCGCGLPGENPVGISAHAHGHDHPHEHGHEHEHTHSHDHPHDHEHEHEHPHTHTHSHHHGDSDHEHSHDAETRRLVEVREAILGKNARLAERNRGFFQARGLMVLNVLSSPGSGKTTFLRETIRGLGNKLKAGVVVGDLATDNDAQRLRA